MHYFIRTRSQQNTFEMLGSDVDGVTLSAAPSEKSITQRWHVVMQNLRL